MSDPGDYPGDMERDDLTDSDIERLLTGAPVEDDDLTQIAQIFDMLRAGDEELEDAAVERLVKAATGALPVATVESPPVPRQASRARLTGVRRRAAAIAMSASVFIAGTSGLAVAADNAKPGDALYGIDRALEAVGIGDGAEQERIQEAEALINAGKIQQGLQHTAEVVDKDTTGDDQASKALMDAADRVETADSEASAATRESVAGLLDYISENVGQIDGRQVAELAVEIGGPDDDPVATAPGDDPEPDVKDPPGRPDDLPSDPPGLTDRDPGPPDDIPANPPGLSDEKPGKPKKDK